MVKLHRVFQEHSSRTLGNTGYLLAPKESFVNLIHNNVPAGHDYANAVRDHASDVAQDLMLILKNSGVESAAIVDIPRGGVPAGQGVELACTYAGLHVDVFHSRTKTNPDIVYDPDINWGKYQALIIVDGVIGSGSTIITHLKQVPEPLRESTVVFSNVTSQLGMNAVIESAVVPHLSFITGHVIPEEDCEWVTFEGGKKVYFLGYNSQRGYDIKLPDFGDAIQPVAP